MKIKLLSPIFGVCLPILALFVAPTARSSGIYSEPFAIPDSQSAHEAGSMFARQTLGVRLDHFSIPERFSAVEFEIQHWGTRITDMRVMIDHKAPLRGQFMLRLYPNESRVFTTSVYKREYQTLAIAPVLSFTYSQYYSFEPPELHQTEEIQTVVNVYVRSSSEYFHSHEVTCTLSRCEVTYHEDFEAKAEEEIKIGGPH